LIKTIKLVKLGPIHLT